MKKTSLFFWITIALSFSYSLMAQDCSYPGAYNCEDAEILCSLGDLNGTYCYTPSEGDNATGPAPTLCNGTGTAGNTIWWAFYGNGENMYINLIPDICEQNGMSCTGIRAGVIEGCSGGNVIDCTSNCADQNSELELSGHLEAGKVYYLWVDGCCGDICGFYNYNHSHTNSLPDPLPKLSIEGARCYGGHVDICTGNIGNLGNTTLELRWTIDGEPHPEYNDQPCINNWQIFDEPYEICVTWTVLKPGIPDPCDVRTQCITVGSELQNIVRMSPIDLCYEDHHYTYNWKPGDTDTVITSSCIDPPCSYVATDISGCQTRYEQSIRLLPERNGGIQYLLYCDTSTFIAEDGTQLDTTICDFTVNWQSPYQNNGPLCDTSYVLNFERFDPQVRLDIDTTRGHNGEVILKGSTDYRIRCLPGAIELPGYWISPDQDTIPGDTIRLSATTRPTGIYKYYLKVNYQDTLHPTSNVLCDYFTGKTYRLDGCTIAYPEVKDVLCSAADKVQFDMDFSWIGMVGDSFTLSSGNGFSETYAIADLPIHVENFPVVQKDSTYILTVCAKGSSQCCMDYPVLLPECKGTGDLPVYGYSPYLQHMSTDRQLLVAYPYLSPAEVSIYSLNGERVKATSVREGYQRIDLNGFTTGIYIAILTSEKLSSPLVYRFVVY